MAGTGALVRSQHATAPKLSSQRCWCKTGSFDGSETTYSHHREDSVNKNERSSMTLEAKDLVWLSDQRDWVYTLETDTETFSSLVSSSRLRPRLKFLESRDRDFDKTFFLTIWRPRPRLNFSYFRDRD